MKYLSGENVKIGDHVLIENGKTHGVVYAVYQTIEEAEKYGLEEIGISIEAEPFGLVFYSTDETQDPVVFRARSGATDM